MCRDRKPLSQLCHSWWHGYCRTLFLTPSANVSVTSPAWCWDKSKTWSVVSACWGLKKNIQLIIPFQGMSRDIWDDGEGVDFQERRGFEARRPPDIFGGWCGTATAAGDCGSPEKQGRLAVLYTKVLCGTPEWAGCGASSLLCAVSPLGQDYRLKLPYPAQY